MDRETFLDRIAARLGRPRRGAVTSDGLVPDPRRETALERARAATDRLERFERELSRLGGKVGFASSRAELIEAVRAEIAFFKAERVVSWALRELMDFGLDTLAREAAWVVAPELCAEGDEVMFRTAALGADVGVTTADFAVANTGTLLLRAGPGRPRGASLLPSVHLCVIRERQLVDRIGETFEFLQRNGGPPSAVHFVSGPSRTSDIENDLTIGVHGPAAVSVIVWREAAA